MGSQITDTSREEHLLRLLQAANDRIAQLESILARAAPDGHDGKEPVGAPHGVAGPRS